MRSPAEVGTLVLRVVAAVNTERPADAPISSDLQAMLFGEGAALDSLGLVNLIVAIEQEMEDEWDVSIALADEKAMSQRRSPFRTLGALIDYIAMRLETEDHG